MGSRVHSTVVFFDANCLRHLRTDETRKALARQLRLVNAVSTATTVNLVEAYRHQSPPMRQRLIDAVRYLAGDRPLAPWPYALLQKVGSALRDGKSGFVMPASGLEQFLTKAPSPTALRRMDKLVREMEDDF